MRALKKQCLTCVILADQLSRCHTAVAWQDNSPLRCGPARPEDLCCPVLQFQRVLDQIRGRSYPEALFLLEHMPFKACEPLKDLLIGVRPDCKDIRLSRYASGICGNTQSVT